MPVSQQPRGGACDERAQIKRYAEAIALWRARYDTAEIGAQLALPESLVAKWVANFRDVVHAP